MNSNGEDEQPWAKVITIEIILDIYEDIMTRYPGRRSCPKDGCLEGCVGNAWQAAVYEQTDGIRYIFPIYLMVYLCRNHCFEDGNKRIAWACFVYILSGYALKIQATDEDGEKLILDIVEKRMEAADVISWAGARLEVRES